MTKDNKIFFRVNPSVLEWWEKRCERLGVKKGEPFQKALELAYRKESDPDFSGQDFSLNLDTDLVEKIQRLAQLEQVDPEVLIANMIKDRIADDERIKESINVFEKTIRKELRIKPSLKQKIDYRADLVGMKPNQYIISVLTANVAKDDQFFGHDQENKLGESNNRLLAIGRNLNQITKAMNQGHFEAYDRDFVERVYQYLRAHVHHVFLLLEQNKKRWE
jgi:hypothetical protein